jgi:hypothetical protein
VDIETSIVERLDRIESLLREQKTIKEFYGTEELAEILKRSEFTVREYARLGRINAQKRKSGRGKHAAWVVSHTELLRIQRDGLLPERRS